MRKISKIGIGAICTIPAAAALGVAVATVIKNMPQPEVKSEYFDVLNDEFDFENSECLDQQDHTLSADEEKTYYADPSYGNNKIANDIYFSYYIRRDNYIDEFDVYKVRVSDESIEYNQQDNELRASFKIDLQIKYKNDDETINIEAEYKDMPLRWGKNGYKTETEEMAIIPFWSYGSYSSYNYLCFDKKWSIEYTYNQTKTTLNHINCYDKHGEDDRAFDLLIDKMAVDSWFFIKNIITPTGGAGMSIVMPEYGIPFTVRFNGWNNYTYTNNQYIPFEVYYINDVTSGGHDKINKVEFQFTECTINDSYTLDSSKSFNVNIGGKIEIGPEEHPGQLVISFDVGGSAPQKNEWVSCSISGQCDVTYIGEDGMEQVQTYYDTWELNYRKIS